MTESFSCPDWLEAHALGDAAMGRAYEALGAESRAVLKTCIARLHQIWGESPDRSSSLRCPRQGFCLEREDRPAEAAVIVCAADYRHPTAFLAAIMPAVLAGVRVVLPLFVPPVDAGYSHGGGQAPDAGRKFALSPDREAPPLDPLLAALELAGVEQAYLLDEETALVLLQELQPETGRLLLVGERPFAQNLVLHAHFAGLACRAFLRPPRYWSERLGRIMTLDCTADRAFSDPAEGRPEHGHERFEPCVRLDAAHEALWIWPDLDPDWFRLRRARLFSP